MKLLTQDLTLPILLEGRLAEVDLLMSLDLQRNPVKLVVHIIQTDDMTAIAILYKIMC